MIAAVNSSRALGMLGASLEGIRRSMRGVEESAEAIAQGDFLPESMVGLIEADAIFKANAVVARTGDRMIGTILDTLA